MTTSVQAQTLSDLLQASAAASQFKDAVCGLEAGKPQSAITYNAGSPPVKVLRFISKLLEERPDLPIEAVSVKASSGCSNFTGSAEVQPGNIRVDFNWDCAWRAKEQGWKDHFGDADQMRAARNLGYQCFERFEIKD